MRFYEIDLIKGFAVINMVIFHIFFLQKNVFNVVNINNYDKLKYMAKFAHTTFIICMGLNSYITYENVNKKGLSKKKYYNKVMKRFLLFFLLSTIISITTYLLFDFDVSIKFGIFHYMTVASLIVSYFVDKPKLNLIAIILINLIYNSNCLKNINKYLGFILGSNLHFNSLDYFPLLKWLPFSLFGVLLGEILYKNNERNFKELHLDNIINNSFILKYISMLGSKSLEVYFIHFPIIYFLLKQIY